MKSQCLRVRLSTKELMLSNCGAGEDSRVPWKARRLNQSILKEINPEYSLKVLMLKLKPRHFGHLMQRPDSLEKTLMPGKIKGRRRRGQQRMRWLEDIAESMDLSLCKFISIESMMPSNHLILCCPLLLLPSIFPSIRVFFSGSVLPIKLAKVLELQLQHQSFQ